MLIIYNLMNDSNPNEYFFAGGYFRKKVYFCIVKMNGEREIRCVNNCQ